MSKKYFLVLLCGVLTFFCSCIHQEYDLFNKEISTDVKLEKNTIALPLGSLKAVQLKELIDTAEIDLLEMNSDGVYGINVSETVSPFETTIDPLTLNIAPINHTEDIEFSKAKIEDIDISGTSPQPLSFTTNEISFDQLNENLPVLKSSVPGSVINDNLDSYLKLLEQNPSFSADVPLNVNVPIENEAVACNFTYTLPKEVEYIDNIKLTSATDKNASGTLVEVKITHPTALGKVNKKLDFDITFPEGLFVLSTVSDDYTLSQGKNKVSVEDLSLTGEATTLKFYIDEIVNVDDRISNGVIDINEKIYYNLNYEVDGTVSVNSSLKREHLEFKVDIDVPLAFRDISGKTKDIKVEFNQIKMDFKGHFDGLQYIDHINYIKFDDEKSFTQFSTTMTGDWFNQFKLKEGHALKIAFKNDLTFNDALSKYKGKGDAVEYNKEKHAYYVYDLSAVANTEWQLSLDSLHIDCPVVNEECDIDIQAEILFVDENDNPLDSLTIAGQVMESMATTIETLNGPKSAEFKLVGSHLVIEDASVHTVHITSDLGASTPFDISEEVPAEIGKIESIELADEVAIKFDMGILGLDLLETEVHLDLHVALPSFLKLRTSENFSEGVNANIDGDTLFVKADYNPKHDDRLSFELLCSELDFTEEFGLEGLCPEVGDDGKKYINYSDSIYVVGHASIDDVEFHSYVLEETDDIHIDINVDIDDMQVKTFHGIYKGEIDEISESFDLDLGEELDFLKDENNKIILSEPQIELVIDNSIGVPVKVDVEIVPKDENGNPIQLSEEIKTVLDILPAEYNESTGEIVAKETKLLLTNDTINVSKVGYKGIQIKSLANLLEKIPTSVDFKIKPIISEEQTHHIDISKPLGFSGSFAVYVPLKFDNFQMCYNHTLEDLSLSLGETLDMFSNVSLCAKMNIINTIPLGLELIIKPLDSDGNLIEDIIIDPLTIRAGLGGNIAEKDKEQNADEVQNFEFKIGCKDGDVSVLNELDKLDLSIKANSESALSGGIKGSQGIKIQDVVFEVTGDIEMEDFNFSDNDEE